MSAKVKWPCKFPDRWTVLPSKRLFPESKDRAPESDEQLSATQEYGVISQAEFMRLAGRRVVQLNQNLELRKRVEIGDFVISMRSFQGGLERAWAEGGIRSSYVVLRPRADLVPGYYQRLFKSVDYIQALQSTANFIRDGQDMNYQNFVLIDLPFPPVSEQFCIAAFLDHETARIDALIEEQQRLIELLKEKRQAVISHAVTKGLDPTVPLKDSGVEWLGEVPAHWVVAGLKWYWSVTDCKHITAEFVDEGIPLASIREVQSRYVALDNAKQTTEVFYRQLIEGGRELVAGDLIFSRNATVGQVAQVANWHPPFAMGQDVCVLKKQYEWLSSDYLQAVLRSPVVMVQLDNLMIGSTFKRVNVEDIRGIIVPMPPQGEQKIIAEYLIEKTEMFNSMLGEAQNTIALLQERRSALISAAVTGKIDVRGWQPPASAPTPELVEEAV